MYPFLKVSFLKRVAHWNPKWFPLADPTRHKDTRLQQENAQLPIGENTREQRACVRRVTAQRLVIQEPTTSHGKSVVRNTCKTFKCQGLRSDHQEVVMFERIQA